MSKAGRHCERGKSLCWVCCKATEDGKVKALLECDRGSVSDMATLLLCWCHSRPVWRTQLEWTIFSPSHLLSTQLVTELRGKVDALRFELPQLKAQLQLTRPQILSKQAIHKEKKSQRENRRLVTCFVFVFWQRCCRFERRDLTYVTNPISGTYG